MNAVTRLPGALMVIALGASASAETLNLKVNGVPMTLTHAVGVEARELLRRLEPEFDDGTYARSPRGDWQLRSRHEGSRSRALQRRGADESLEALYSVVDVSASLSPPLRRPAFVPGGLETDSTVETLGASPSAQWNLRSRRSAESVLRAIRLQASATGWRVDAEDRQGIALSKGAERARVLAAANPRATGCRITVIAWESP